MPERSHPRFAVEIDCVLETGADRLIGRTNNVSRGGMALVVGRTVEVSSVVELTITAVFEGDTYAHSLRLPATIVWCSKVATGYQIGVRFAPLDAAQARALDDLVDVLEND